MKGAPESVAVRPRNLFLRESVGSTGSLRYDASYSKNFERQKIRGAEEFLVHRHIEVHPNLPRKRGLERVHADGRNPVACIASLNGNLRQLGRGKRVME